MTRFASVLLAALAVLLFAVPAAAQDADPYGEVLPSDIEAPGEVTTPPDAADSAADSGVAGSTATPAPVVPAARGTLARTGLGLTVGMALLAAALLVMGTGAVVVARRRAHSPG